MEKRIVNVIIQAPGGTAAKNSSTYKLSLPSSWVKEMGISEENRQVEMKFDGTSITITKKLDMKDTPKMRRLTCPQCSHKGLCVEVYDDGGKAK